MNIIWRALVSRKLYRVGLAVFLLLTIYLMFNRPDQVHLAGLINDKAAHALTFFILTLLFSRGFPDYYGYWALVGLAFFGLFIEGIQFLIPWRSFSVADWAADIAGIILYHILHEIRVRFVTVRRNRGE